HVWLTGLVTTGGWLRGGQPDWRGSGASGLGAATGGAVAPYSKAPMSQETRGAPRWSRLFTGAAAQVPSTAIAIAGLTGCSAVVGVGAPLSRSPAGSSSGSAVRPGQLGSVDANLLKFRLPPPSVIGPGPLTKTPGSQ